MLRIHADFLDNRVRVSGEKRWSCFASQFICSLAELDGFSDLAGLVGMKDEIYHSRELPQILFLSRQRFFCFFFSRQKYACLSLAGAATSITFVATKDCRDKHVFCGDKSMFVVTKVCLWWQKYVCGDKRIFVATSLLLSRHTRDKPNVIQ